MPPVGPAGAPSLPPGAPNQIERLESGLLSYGVDNISDSDPFEVGLGKLVSLDRTDNFIGKEALFRKAEQGPRRKLVGIVINGKPISPNEHPWPATVDGKPAGTVRAACYSPRREENIGMALLDIKYSEPGIQIDIEGNNGLRSGEIVPLPLVLRGTPIPKNR